MASTVQRPTQAIHPVQWICIVMMTMQLPFVIRHLSNLWRFRPHYEFFPVVLIVCVWLFCSRWPEAASIPQQTPKPAIYLFGIGLVFLALASAFVSPWLATIAFIINLGAVTIRLTGSASRDLIAPWMLCWLIVPPPFSLDTSLVQWMQQMTADTVSNMLEWRGVDHLLSGNVFQLSGQRLFVAEACSGCHSQLLLIAACLVFGIVQRREWTGIAVLVSAAMFWSIIANIARVMTVAYLASEYELDLSRGWIHEMLGFGLLVTALLLVLSTDQLFRGIRLVIENPDESMNASEYLAEEARVHPQLVQENHHSLTERVIDRVLGPKVQPTDNQAMIQESRSKRSNASLMGGLQPLISIAMVIAVIGILQVAVMASDLPGVRLAGSTQQLPSDTLPNEIEDWQLFQYTERQRERGSDEGEFSQIWRYVMIDAAVQLSIDYPFFGWHELADCYESRGWNVIEQRIVSGESPETDAVNDYVEVTMIGPSGQYGYLLFSVFDAQGRHLAAEGDYWSNRVSLNPIVTAVRGLPMQSAQETTTQIQMFSITDTPLTGQLKSSVNRLFTTARTLAVDRILNRGQQP